MSLAELLLVFKEGLYSIGLGSQFLVGYLVDWLVS
jgi:hypothetical protein